MGDETKPPVFVDPISKSIFNVLQNTGGAASKISSEFVKIKSEVQSVSDLNETFTELNETLKDTNSILLEFLKKI